MNNNLATEMFRVMRDVRADVCCSGGGIISGSNRIEGILPELELIENRVVGTSSIKYSCNEFEIGLFLHITVGVERDILPSEFNVRFRENYTNQLVNDIEIKLHGNSFYLVFIATRSFLGREQTIAMPKVIEVFASGIIEAYGVRMKPEIEPKHDIEPCSYCSRYSASFYPIAHSKREIKIHAGCLGCGFGPKIGFKTKKEAVEAWNDINRVAKGDRRSFGSETSPKCLSDMNLVKNFKEKK